uniref:Uncharacterized protein n=1 Tax=Rhizophora mucronata TaxID=61149 RepID=A0A2P2PRE2_RHIMU
MIKDYFVRDSTTFLTSLVNYLRKPSRKC